jgi:hypothetical protein
VALQLRLGNGAKIPHCKISLCYELLIEQPKATCSMGLKDEDMHLMIIALRTRCNYAYSTFILEIFIIFWRVSTTLSHKIN